MFPPVRMVAALAVLLTIGMSTSVSACAQEEPTSAQPPVHTQSPSGGPVGPSDPEPAEAPARPAPSAQEQPARGGAPESTPTPAPTTTADLELPGPRMVQATMRIPAIGLRPVRVAAYRGSPDDGPGTRIQDGGVAASPFGSSGGVGPGQVGNYIVTAHRTTEPAPFAELPALERGDHVLVTAREQVLDYRIVGTRSTSFRSPASLARQAAAVPGHPGRRATRPMITLSTCATPEDHARGNYWADEFGNPEHRIDKIGVLVDVRSS